MALSNKLQLLQVQERDGFALNAPNNVISRLLSANTPANISLSDYLDSDGKKPTIIIFASNGPFFVAWNADDATVPGNVDDGSAAEFSPTLRKITNSITKFSIVSSTSAVVTMLLYSGV